MLADGIRGSLKPFGAVNGLFRREHFDMSPVKRIESIAIRDVTIQRCRVVLRQDEDPFQSRVEAVADGDIDQAILSAKWNRGFGTILCQRKEPLPCATRQNNGDDMR